MASVSINVDDLQVAEGVAVNDADRATETRTGINADDQIVTLHLTEQNAKAYDEARAAAYADLDDFMAAGTVTGHVIRHDGAPRTARARSNGARRSGGSASSEQREQNKAMREWLRNNGAVALSERGRLPGVLVTAYHAGDVAAVQAWNDTTVIAE